MKTWCVTVFLILLAGLIPLTGAHAQDALNGKYLVTNYTVRDYDGGTQNWEIVQDSKGFIYAANRSGILVYDGSFWQLIGTRLETPLRSIAIDDNDRVYVGAVGEFGYLEPDTLNAFRFVALSDTISANIPDVWETHHVSDGVYFVTRQKIYRYFDGNLSEISSPQGFQRSFLHEDAVYVGISGRGMHKIEGDTLVQLPGIQEMASQYVNSMLKAPSLFRSENGVYLITNTRQTWHYGFDTQRLTRADNAESRRYIAPTETYKSTSLPDGDLAFATLSSGVVITDAHLQVRHVINRDKGLQLNMVLNVFSDRDGSIWAALNNGISRIDMYEHVFKWDETTDFTGGVLSFQKFQDELVIGSSTGLYTTIGFGMTTADIRLSLMTSNNYQIWDMETVRLRDGSEVLLLAGSLGLFYYDGREFHKLLDEAVFSMEDSSLQPGWFYLGLRQGFAAIQLVEITGGRLQVRSVKEYKSPPFEFRSMVEDELGGLWLGSRFNGLFYVRPGFIDGIDENNDSDWVVQFNQEHGLPSLMDNNVHRYSGGLLFTTEKGVFTYDGTGFVRDDRFAAYADEHVFRLQETRPGNFWLISGGNLERLTIADDLEVRQQRYLAYLRDEPLIAFFFTEDIAWVGSGDALYMVRLDQDPGYGGQFSALVRSVYMSQDSLIYRGIGGKDVRLEIPYGQADITFAFAAPRFVIGSGMRYQTMLEGYDRNWSNWSIDTRRTYTNLPNGRYVFRVRAIDVLGVSSEEGVLHVFIPTPWFKTIWAYLFYILVILLVGYGIVRWKLHRVEKQNRNLELKIIQRTAELQVEKRRLESMNENLKALDENRDKFLSVVAHDLRNPLMIIRSSSDLIEEEIEDKAAILEFSKYIRDAALKMQSIIEELLEDRAKKIRLHVDMPVINLAPIVEKICSENAVWADSKDIEISLDLQPDCFVKADGAHIGVIVDNLLSNALKYTPNGKKVTISLERIGDRVKFCVEDEGPGLLATEIQKLGTPGMKLSARPTGGEGSTGMGLYIVKDLLDINGGELKVTSPGRGKGSRFCVELPYADLE